MVYNEDLVFGCLTYTLLGGVAHMYETFEIGQSDSQRWHFQLKAPTGEVLIQSDDYHSEYECREMIEVIRKYALTAHIKRLEEGELH